MFIPVLVRAFPRSEQALVPPFRRGGQGGCGEAPGKSSRTARPLQKTTENGVQAHSELPRSPPLAPPPKGGSEGGVFVKTSSLSLGRGSQ